jgi:RND family efflux transporter MFP subunit
MAESEPASILRRLRHLTAEAGGATDAQLLERFAENRDEAAFEVLLWRHARLVFGVCVRVLRDQHDAEDAFQATYLALARHAGRNARREAVAAWLHKVAYRVALTARAQRARRYAREKLHAAVEAVAGPCDVAARLENQELQRVLDQEIGRLPDRFQSVVVLCYLEGKTVDEAALLLGCPRGTVASRLARARERLQIRLTRRGLAMTAGWADHSQANAAPLPFALIPSLSGAAVRYAAGKAPAASQLSPRIIALTEGVLRAMILHRVKTGMIILIALLGVLLAGGGLAIGLHAHAAPEDEQPRAVDLPGAPADVSKDKTKGPQPVTVTRPVRREAAPFQDYTGRLEAPRAVEVRPAVSGFVTKVHFNVGAEVHQGDLLFELDSRAVQLALEKAEAERILALARKKQSDADFQRVARLRAAGTLPQDEIDQRTAQVAAAEAALKTAEVEVARAKLDLEATKVRAPISGKVGRPLAEPGTLVFRGPDRATLLTTITVLDPIVLGFDVDEQSYLSYQRLLREGAVQGVGSSLRMGLPNEGGFPQQGTLESFEDHVNPESGTVRVRGRFSNPGQLLKPGMFARVRMAVGPPRAVLEVPEEAILSDQGKRFVFIVSGRNIAERRPVDVGQEENGLRVVEKGLRDGEWVIITGLNHLHPGDEVQPRKMAVQERTNPAPGRGR